MTNIINWIFSRAIKGTSIGTYLFSGKLNNNMVARLKRESESDERVAIFCKGLFTTESNEFNYVVTSNGYGKYLVTFVINYKSEKHFQSVKNNWNS